MSSCGGREQRGGSASSRARPRESARARRKGRRSSGRSVFGQSTPAGSSFASCRPVSAASKRRRPGSSPLRSSAWSACGHSSTISKTARRECSPGLPGDCCWPPSVRWPRSSRRAGSPASGVRPSPKSPRSPGGAITLDEEAALVPRVHRWLPAAADSPAQGPSYLDRARLRGTRHGRACLHHREGVLRPVVHGESGRSSTRPSRRVRPTVS